MFDFSRAGALNAYASARQGFDLRSPRDEDSAERPLPALDDEDRALLEDGREDVEKLIKRATQAD